jgi:hypothetical protein
MSTFDAGIGQIRGELNSYQKLIIAAALTFSSSAMAQATLITDRDNAMDWLRANLDTWMQLSRHVHRRYILDTNLVIPEAANTRA